MDINIIEGRGTIRLFVAGMICTQAAYFYFLNHFFTKNRPIYLILSLLTLSIFILQGTRQLIFALIFLTLVNLLFARKIKSRFAITLVLSLAIFAIFLTFREIFLELVQVSTSQAHYLGEGIRLKAARFFLTAFPPNAWAYIFGNGDSSIGSAYGMQMMIYAANYGYYLADLGILGDYIKYGLVFTLAGLVMVIRAIRMKVSPEHQYLKFYIFTQCFTMIAGLGIFGGVDIILLLILYVFDVDRAETLFNPITLESEEAASIAGNN